MVEYLSRCHNYGSNGKETVVAVTSVLEGTVGSVTCVSPQCVSTKPSNEAYRPLQTAVIRFAGYPGLNSCNAAARSTKRRNNQHVGRAHPSKTLFFFSMGLILLCSARVPVTLSRPGCQLPLLQFRSSGLCARLAFNNTDSEWPDSHFPKKSNTSRFKALVAIIFSLVPPLILPSRSPKQK